jgi:hypothetical protein
MSERDDKTDPQTKIRLINPLAYTHPMPPFGNCATDAARLARLTWGSIVRPTSTTSATTATPKCWLLSSKSHEPPCSPSPMTPRLLAW